MKELSGLVFFTLLSNVPFVTTYKKTCQVKGGGGRWLVAFCLLGLITGTAFSSIYTQGSDTGY